MKRYPQHSTTAIAAFAAMMVLAAPRPAAAQDAQEAEALEEMSEVDKVRYQQALHDYFGRILSNMEAARLRGDCEGPQRLRQTLEINLNTDYSVKLLSPESIADWRRRADAILQRPCVPSGAPSPVESVVEDLQFNPATIISTPERPAGDEPAPSSQSVGDGPENIREEIPPPSGQLLPPPPPPPPPEPVWKPVIGMPSIGEILFGSGEVFWPRFGSGEVNWPQLGVGFRREGPPESAPETFAQTTPDTVSTLGGSVALRLGDVGVEAHYSEGDASNVFEVPGNSGIDSGVVYGDDAPSGSSGIATPFGLTGGTSVDFRQFGIEASFSFMKRFSDRGGLGLGVYAGYDRVERDYAGSAAYSGGGPAFIFTFSQDRQQEVSEDYFGLGLTARVAVPLGDRIFGHLTGSAGGYYRNTDLSSVERNLCNFCPPSDQDFTISIDDSDNGFGFRGEAGAGFELRLSRRVSLYVGGSADYRSSVGGIFNPSSGDQVFFDGLNTALRTEDSWSWQAGGGIVIRFGGN